MLQRGDKGQRQHLERCNGTPPRKTGIPFRKSLKQKMLELKLFGLMEFTQDYARSAKLLCAIKSSPWSMHEIWQIRVEQSIACAKSLNTGLLHAHPVPCTGVARKMPSHIHFSARSCIDIKTSRKSKNLQYSCCRFAVIGSTGIQYIVELNSGKKRCDCPDHIQRKHVCKHMYFVYKYLDIFKAHQRRHWHQVNMFADARMQEDLISLCSCFGSVMLYKSRLPLHAVQVTPITA